MARMQTNGFLLTAKNEIYTRKAGNPGFVFVCSSDFSAFHSNKSKYRTKKTQTDSCDHQTSASLDVACKHEVEVNI